MALLPFAGCGVGEPTARGDGTTPTASPPASATPSPVPVRVPDDGITLQALGFDNGPGAAFSLPRSAVISTQVDQAGSVTVVLESPSPDAVAAYLRRTLPRTGFTITGDAPPVEGRGSAALTFTGFGWSGDFTGSGRLSAVVLRR
jgi:hypothetical protein